MKDLCMDKIIQFISPLKIPVDVIMGMCVFITVFLIFAPKKIILKMGLDNLLSSNFEMISLLCIISFSYFLVFSVKIVYAKISEFKVRISQINMLKKLTQKEKDLLLKIYKNDHSMRLDTLNPTVGMLHSKGFIYMCNNMGLLSEFSFALQPFVVDFIDKHPKFK